MGGFGPCPKDAPTRSFAAEDDGLGPAPPAAGVEGLGLARGMGRGAWGAVGGGGRGLRLAPPPHPRPKKAKQLSKIDLEAVFLCFEIHNSIRDLWESGILRNVTCKAALRQMIPQTASFQHLEA